jgi:hypothetical protein
MNRKTAAAAALATPPAASLRAASVVPRYTKVYPNGPVFVTSARNMTCAAAKREQARYKWTGKNRFTTPGRFTCRPSGRGSVGYRICCVKDVEGHRIEFQD